MSPAPLYERVESILAAGIADGIRLIPGAMHLVLVPGLMLLLTVLSINVFADGVRDALDPKAGLRGRL